MFLYSYRLILASRVRLVEGYDQLILLQAFLSSHLDAKSYHDCGLHTYGGDLSGAVILAMFPVYDVHLWHFSTRTTRHGVVATLAHYISRGHHALCFLLGGKYVKRNVRGYLGHRCRIWWMCSRCIHSASQYPEASDRWCLVCRGF